MNDIMLAAAPVLLVIGCYMIAVPNLNPDGKWVRLIGAYGTSFFMIRYLVWRGVETLPPLTWSFDALLGYVYFLIEVVSSMAGLLLFHVLSRTVSRSAEADAHPPESLPGGPPLIDLLIPTYNEDRDILERTIVGAISQDYPRLRVWVLDDSRREWLRDLAEQHGAGYMTRPNNLHGKAGNMNAGIAQLRRMEQKPEIIAVLDADFVAKPDFLRRAVGLFHDDGVAVVQTPQLFFNPDPIQLNLGGVHVIPDEQRFFFDVILPSKDAHGTAFSCGTSALVRADRLAEIGGFPTESVTEDLLLSIKFKALGYRTVYLGEPLTVGLAPEGLGEYVTQRGRWCLGTMQIVRTQWGPLSRGQVPLRMRLHTLDTVLFWTVSPLMRIFGLLGPVLYWWTGIVVMNTDLPSIFTYLGPYWISCIWFLGWVSRGTNVPILCDAMALLMTVDSIRASVIGLFGNRNQKFKVTAKGLSRDRVVVHWGMMQRFVLVAVFLVGGIGFRFLAGSSGDTPPSVELMNLFWSFYNLLCLVIAALLCVELPRTREERFRANEPCQVLVAGAVLHGELVNISVSGARIALTHLPLVTGNRLRVRVAEVGEVEAEVLGQHGYQWRLRMFPTPTQRVALIRKLFYGGYVRLITELSTFALIRVFYRRMFTFNAQDQADAA